MWVKICGWNDPAVLKESLARGVPDAIGLNFYQKSPRSVRPPMAIQLRRQLPPTVDLVGVFVNHIPTQIRKTVIEVGLTHIQLHGNETPEFVTLFKDLKIIRVYRLTTPSLDPIKKDLLALAHLKVRPWACLVDAWDSNEYGGTGKLAPWTALTEWKAEWPRLILAGGLTPENVAEAIRTVRPFGVDAASGVESERGRKSPELVHQFIQAARTVALPERSVQAKSSD